MVRPHLTPIVIAGPTASGKSGLAMRWALEHKGEIICADSRQFYAGMSIGTACPTYDEMRQIPHHGYGIIDPKNHKIDAGFFVDFAQKKIKEVQEKNRRPIIVGGTGLYLRALCYGIDDVPPSDINVVTKLSLRCKTEGLEKLYQELLHIDPKTSERIQPNDRYRIIRALEIYEHSGKRPSDLRVSFYERKPKLKAIWAYKKLLKEELISRIEIRVHHMFNNGLIDEAIMLRNRLAKDHWALSVMGFKEALSYVDNDLTLEQAIEKTTIRHRQYAKRQYTWFNKEPFYRYVV